MNKNLTVECPADAREEVEQRLYDEWEAKKNMIKIGDNVRSFDFAFGKFGRDLEGERACFVEGVVEDFEKLEGCMRYKILVNKDVFGGDTDRSKRVGSYVFPPLNGTASMLEDSTNFVDKI
jgi:hypothetical protein